jgi:hypothetical protein
MNNCFASSDFSGSARDSCPQGACNLKDCTATLQDCNSSGQYGARTAQPAATLHRFEGDLSESTINGWRTGRIQNFYF